MALSVSTYVVFTLGGFVLLESGLIETIAYWIGYGSAIDNGMTETIMFALGSFNPLFFPVHARTRVCPRSEDSARGFWLVQIACLIVTMAVSAGLYALILLTFERCLGRTSARPRRGSSHSPETHIDLGIPNPGRPRDRSGLTNLGGV